MTRVDRRGFLRAAGVAAATGCSGPARSGPFAGRTLTVFVYSGLDRIFREQFAEPFSQQTGATVLIDAGWWDAIGKLKASPAGRPAYDLVLTDATQGGPAVKAGMFRQLDLGRIPNVKNLAPSAVNNPIAAERYGVTFPESAMSMAWDRRQVGDGLSDWGGLLRSDLAGKLAFYNSFYFSLYTFACMKAAADGRPGTAHDMVTNDLPGVLDYARRERGRVRVWWPTGPKMTQDMLLGNFAAGNAHSVTMLQAAPEKPGVIGYATPAADRAYVQLMWAVPADTPNADLAETAIDYILRRDVQAAISRRGAGTGHPEAAAEVAAANPGWAATYPHTPAGFAAMRYFPYDTYLAHWDEIVAVWEHEILRSS